MAFLDVSLVVIIILFIILLVWSRVQSQSILDTVVEIKDIVSEIKK